MLSAVHHGNETSKYAPAAEAESLLDELVRDSARQRLAAALPAWVAAHVEAHAGDVNEDVHQLCVRNGIYTSRELTTVAGAVSV